MAGRPEKKKVVFIGGGGHCRSVINTALRMESISAIVITDPEISVGTYVDGCKVVGSDGFLPVLYEEGFTNAFITVGSLGDTGLRRRLKENAFSEGFIFPNIIDPSAIVSDMEQVGEGVFIGKYCVVNTGVIIGEHAIINTGAIIEHECKVGAFTHVAVGAVVCGDVEIGDDVLIGAGATVAHGVRIGKRSVIGAGAVVTKDIPENSVAVGVPARIIKQNNHIIYIQNESQ